MKLPHKLRRKLSHKNHVIIFAVCFAFVGIFALLVARAATPTASFETESSTLSGTATSLTDTSASGGSAVKFSSGQQAVLYGWQLTTTNIGLAPSGNSCSTLPSYTGPSKPLAGTIISNRLISTGLDLSNGNITITNSCIRPTSVSAGMAVVTTTDFNVCSPGCTSARGQVTITDSEFDGSLVSSSQISKSCAFSGVGILERNYIHDVGSGICFFGTGSTYTASAVNNYVDRMRAYGDAATTGSHNETFTIRDHITSVNPGRNLMVKGNYFDINSGNDTGAIFIQAYAGFIDNVTVEDNLLTGRGYQLILEANTNGYGSHMHAVNNRFSGTGYGPGYHTGGPGWATWTENYINDPTKVDNKGAIVTPR